MISFKSFIDEADFKLTPGRKKELEKLAKDLPDKDFKSRYGKDWKSVKIATAMNMLKKKHGFKEGTGKHQGKLGSFLVDYKGVEVNVGSGLNDELREQIWKDKDSHIGRIIEVRYQEETPDGSLRFPTFVCFRNDKS